MDTNQVKFDSMTGKPINTGDSMSNIANQNVQQNQYVRTPDINKLEQVSEMPEQSQKVGIPYNQSGLVDNASINQQLQSQNYISNQAYSQNIQEGSNIPLDSINMSMQMQSIPTVNQSRQEFINNAQNIARVEKNKKEDGVNYLFIIILFTIIFVAVFLVFPFLINYI